VFPVLLHAPRAMAEDVATLRVRRADGGAAGLRRRRAHRRGHRAGVPSPLQPGRRPGRPQPLRAGRAARTRRRGGRGGSALMHRAFREGRRVFVSAGQSLSRCTRTRAHAAVRRRHRRDAMIAMAHRLHALGRPSRCTTAPPAAHGRLPAELGRAPGASTCRCTSRTKARADLHRADAALRRPACMSTPAERRATWTVCSRRPAPPAGPSPRCTANTSACPKPPTG
jgi:hypothetical protein